MAIDPRMLAQAVQQYRSAAPELQQPLMGQMIPRQQSMPMPQQQQQNPWAALQSNPQMWKAMGQSPLFNNAVPGAAPSGPLAGAW